MVRDTRRRAAREHVIGPLARNGWQAGRQAADVLVGFAELGQELPPDVLSGYIRLARATVAAEMRLVQRLPPGTIPLAAQVAIFHEKLFAAWPGRTGGRRSEGSAVSADGWPAGVEERAQGRLLLSAQPATIRADCT